MACKVENQIFEEIQRIKKELELTKSEFNYVTDEILIDSYIYKMVYLNKRYDYFISLAKKAGLKAFN